MRTAEVTGVTLARIPCAVEADRVTGGAQGGLSFPARAGLPLLVFPLLDPRLRGGRGGGGGNNSPLPLVSSYSLCFFGRTARGEADPPVVSRAEGVTPFLD